jgi:hypothetical protein
LNAPTQYIVLHRSCKVPGIAAAQASHAATECLRTLPVPSDTSVCVLVAECENDLVSLSERLTAAGIHHVLIREPDPPYNGAAVAVGVEPQDRSVVQPFVADFKVFR